MTSRMTKSRLEAIAFSVFIVCGGWILIVLDGIRQVWRKRNEPKRSIPPRQHARLFAEPTGVVTIHDLPEWRAWGHVARVDHRIRARVDVKAEGPHTAMLTAFQRGVDACDGSVAATSSASRAQP